MLNSIQINQAVTAYTEKSVVQMAEMGGVRLFRLRESEATCILATVRSNSHVKLQIFSDGKEVRVADMKYRGHRWIITGHKPSATGEALKDIISNTFVEEEVARLPSGRAWSTEETEVLVRAYASLIHSGSVHPEIDVEALRRKFGKVLNRSANSITSRLQYIGYVLSSNDGVLPPSVFDNAMIAILDLRNRLEPLGIDVWVGPFKRKVEKPKVTVNSLGESIPSIVHMGSYVSMKTEELESLLLKLQAK